LTSTFHVKNYDKFQHYADRTPPWIKLYNELLDNYEFGLLPDASKAHLIAIWLLASRSKNKIPLDPKWVAKRISASEPVDLTILRNAGFIEFDQPCSDMLADRKQDARPEEKRVEVEEKRKELSANADDSFQEFWKNYPTDRNMSRKAALSQWRKLSAGKRAAATAALPGFKAYCAANSWYRPKHAEGWLSQERFEGYAGAEPQFDQTDGRGWTDRLRVFREKAMWNPKWGPDPKQPDCKCPPEILNAEKAA
jgi:hypothetical protein